VVSLATPRFSVVLNPRQLVVKELSFSLFTQISPVYYFTIIYSLSFSYIYNYFEQNTRL